MFQYIIHSCSLCLVLLFINNMFVWFMFGSEYRLTAYNYLHKVLLIWTYLDTIIRLKLADNI